MKKSNFHPVRPSQSHGNMPFDHWQDRQPPPGGRFYRFNRVRIDRVYRLRFECETDIQSLLEMLEDVGELVHAEVLAFRHPIRLPECTIQVKTLNLERIRGFCRIVPDGHVMVQTIQPPHSYTGTRNWHV